MAAPWRDRPDWAGSVAADLFCENAMHGIGSVGQASTHVTRQDEAVRTAQTPAARGGDSQTAVPAPAAGDRVELSTAAAAYDPTGEVERRIPAIRAQIAAGTYLTEEKLEAAIEGLLRDALGIES